MDRWLNSIGLRSHPSGHESVCDRFSKYHTDRTLLVSMVLDYSKVHTRMGRPGSESQQPGPNVSSGGGMRQEPLFTAETPCDVALVTEEVVDGKQYRRG